MSLLTASQECKSIARKFYKLFFLKGRGCFGEHMLIFEVLEYSGSRNVFT